MWMQKNLNACAFQLTTSRRGRPALVVIILMTTAFQLTTSRRGRRHCFLPRILPDSLSTHDLTKRSTVSSSLRRTVSVSFNSRPHEEVDLIFSCKLLRTFPFNSRPHEEVDHLGGNTRPQERPFNSRPHEEVDSFPSPYISGSILSTHDLTKRSTRRTSQKESIRGTFNSRPHEEVD